MTPAPSSDPTPATEAVLRLTISGDLLASTVEQERGRLLALLDKAAEPVVMDLGRVKEIDSLGITLVLGVYKTCQKLGVPFGVEGVAPDIMRVFKLFSLPKLFPVKEA